ncbi:MAG TPA: VOC family protein [Solirubrobacteraceae bacterium]|nr:VOC family protein [Solirubrobacteraceae bacterium]
MSTTSTGIEGICLIVIPVADQDRSIEFYESIGFEKRTDIPFGERYRWVEVYPPSGQAGIALAPPPPGRDVVATQTGITLTTADIESTHAALAERGADVDPEVARMGDPVPPMFWFRDPDGHSLMVVESAR